MHFELTEEHLAVKEAARDFAQNVLKPEVIDRDNAQRFPAEEVKQLGELGFMGMMVDPKYGGPVWIPCRMCWRWKKSRKWMPLPRFACR